MIAIDCYYFSEFFSGCIFHVGIVDVKNIVYSLHGVTCRLRALDDFMRGWGRDGMGKLPSATAPFFNTWLNYAF